MYGRNGINCSYLIYKKRCPLVVKVWMHMVMGIQTNIPDSYFLYNPFDENVDQDMNADRSNLVRKRTSPRLPAIILLEEKKLHFSDIL